MIWFYLSQTIHHIHFVSDHVSQLLHLKLYIIFPLSQTICHTEFVSNYPWYWHSLKTSVKYTLSQTKEIGVRFGVGRLGLGFRVRGQGYICLICLKLAIIFTLSQTMCHIQFVLNQQDRVRVRGLGYICLIWFYLSQTGHHIHIVSDHISCLLRLRLCIIFSLSQTICHIYFVANWVRVRVVWYDSICLKLSIIFTLSQTMCHIYFVLNQQDRSRVRGLGLEWFDMIPFVSNYPSYSLCLRPYIIFTLSQG